MKKKGIAILGSTGSIGTQTVEVILQHKDKFQAEVLVANNNADLLIEQSKLLDPNMIVIANKEKYSYVCEQLANYPIKVFAGAEAINQVVGISDVDIVIAAMVGFSGLMPVIKAIEAKKIVALANKETLVVAGDYITSLSRQYNAPIIPVDSEHSAIFQCLAGENSNKIEKILLTASGGAFRGKNLEELKKVTLKQALKHPNWDMGAKVTIDSASLMNKGLELIEAKWLFGIDAKDIEVVIHPQSIIHSMVQFIDGSIKAQMSMPDMRMPIQYAMSFPDRINSNFPRFKFDGLTDLTFEKPDLKVFKNLKLAIDAINIGGNMPCILNAANEIAVDLFIKENISFIDMPKLVEQCMEKAEFIKSPSIDELVNTDKVTRIKALEYYKNI